MTWSGQNNVITSKANSKLSFLRRNLKGCPEKLRETAYFSLVRSFLEYSAIVWHPSPKIQLPQTGDGAAKGCSFREKQVWNVWKCNADVRTTYLDSAIKKTRKQSSHSLLQNYQQFGCGTTFMSGKGWCAYQEKTFSKVPPHRLQRWLIWTIVLSNQY